MIAASAAAQPIACTAPAISSRAASTSPTCIDSTITIPTARRTAKLFASDPDARAALTTAASTISSGVPLVLLPSVAVSATTSNSVVAASATDTPRAISASSFTTVPAACSAVLAAAVSSAACAAVLAAVVSSATFSAAAAFFRCCFLPPRVTIHSAAVTLLLLRPTDLLPLSSRLRLSRYHSRFSSDSITVKSYNLIRAYLHITVTRTTLVLKYKSSAVIRLHRSR